MKKIIEILLVIVIFSFGLGLRVYKLDQNPPSLNWDEVAASYNAFTIANWGKDEYGKVLPLVFHNFGDDKHPVHIYLTAPFIKIFGLSDFMARFPAALISSLSIIVLYILAKLIFNSKLAATFSALSLAISMYHIHYSRGLWEVDFMLFFFLLGLMFFYLAIKKNIWALPLSVAGFGLSFFSYHSAKFVIPLVILVLLITHFSEIKKNVKVLIVSCLIGLLFLLGIILDPRILGLSRMGQATLDPVKIQNTLSYKVTKNNFIGTMELAIKNMPGYFSWDYLFVHGDQNARGSVKVFGQFYKIELILLIVGLIALAMMRSKASLILLIWLLLAPFPAAFSTSTTNSTRAFLMLGVMNLIIGLGASKLIGLVKNKVYWVLATTIILGLLGWECKNYLKYYFTVYPEREAIEWQYGMKQVVEYVAKHPEYDLVYMDKIRQQPYIFFLNYLKIPLPKLLKTVKYDQTRDNTYNTVESFDKYNFGNWDPIDSAPIQGNLYIITPSYYSGLRSLNSFGINKIVKYPNGSDAFYIISTNE